MCVSQPTRFCVNLFNAGNVLECVYAFSGRGKALHLIRQQSCHLLLKEKAILPYMVLCIAVGSKAVHRKRCSLLHVILNIAKNLVFSLRFFSRFRSFRMTDGLCNVVVARVTILPPSATAPTPLGTYVKKRGILRTN